MALKIYTKFGDKGRTALFGGKRVSKASSRIEAYGELDELNSFIGLARSYIKDRELSAILSRIQEDLFTLGADLATPLKAKSSKKVSRIQPQNIRYLEEIIDRFMLELPPLRSFILPGGSPLAAHLHVARAVCRRAERRVVALSEREKINGEAIRYLNRLSDLLFVASRLINKRRSLPEDRWHPK